MNVDGEDYTNIEHEKAVAILKACNKQANLLIKRTFQKFEVFFEGFFLGEGGLLSNLIFTGIFISIILFDFKIRTVFL